MFLIYNFHLAEAKNSKIEERYIKKIEEVLKKEISEANKEKMKAYGMEAFYYASLKKLDDEHLLEGWKKMNRLWTILKQKPIEKGKLEEINNIKELCEAKKQKKYVKIATVIDHAIKICEKEKAISKKFIEELQEMFPFLIESFFYEKFGI